MTHSFLSREAFLTAGAIVFAIPYAVRAQGLQKIRFIGVPTDDLTPVYYALRNGLYEKAGIDMEMIPAMSGSAATTALVAGTYDLGKGSPIGALIGHLRALPVTIIGNGPIWDAKNPFTLLLIAADSPIKTAAQLNGKIASVAGLNDLSQLAALVWMDKSGGDSRTLKWVEIPNSAAGAALAEHRVDVGSLNEPQVSAAIESGEYRVLAPCFSAIAKHYPTGVYQSSGDFVKREPEVVRRWMRITYEAAAYTNRHRAKTAPMMSEVTKIPSGVFAKIARVDAATRHDPAALQPVIDYAAKYRFIERAFPAKDAYFS